MKKNIRIRIILLVCLLLGLANTEAWGQVEYGKYYMKITFSHIKNNGNGLCKSHFKIYHRYKMGTRVLLDIFPGGIGENKFTTTPDPVESIFSANIKEKPKYISFYAERGWRVFLEGCSWEAESTEQHKLDYTQPYLIETFSKGDSGDDLFTRFDTPITLELYPYQINITYSDDTGQNLNQLLPMKDAITLKAPTGFHPNVYNWQYSTDGNNWINFPSSLQNVDQITFSGTDIISENTFKSLIKEGKNIHIRINTYTKINKDIPSTITLYPSIELPHITNVSYEPETCNGTEDATILITFDRNLLPGEVLYVEKGGFIGENDKELDQNSGNTAQLKNMAAGTYNLKLKGTLNGYDSYGNSASHKAQITISPRPAITHSVTTTKNISCINGSDGTISITASGGTGTFLGNLMRDGSNDIIQQVNFAAGATGTFTRLKAGTYKITVYDSNNCSNNIQQTATLSEPAQAIEATLEYTKQPLAYDSSDGEVTIRITGGTPSATGYTARMKSESGQTYTPQSSSKDGDGFLYTFKGLHRGKHDVTIEDKNYSSLIPQDQQAPCGCVGTLSFYLDAPPAQEIAIEETHFINCYGSDEGELTAHAKGGVKNSGMPYIYTWYKQSESGLQELTQPNDSIIRNLETGTYKVKMTDANNISKLSEPFVLVQPDSLSIRFETDRIGCAGNSRGRVKAFVSGGTAPYKYQWLGMSGTKEETLVPSAGRYTVKVTDQRNCTLIASTEVIDPVDATLENVVLPLAYDSSDGEATIRIKGGVQMSNGYSTLFRSETGQTYTPKASAKDGDSFLYTFKGLHRGKHYLTTGDKVYNSPSPDQQVLCGSSDTLSFYLSAPPAQEINIAETHFVNCYGSNEGELTAHAQGGVPFAGGIMPYRYTWYRLSEQGTQELTLPNDSVARGLFAGTYQVKMTDANRISTLSAPFLLVQPDSLSVTFETADLGCSGTSTGKVKAIVKGGTPPYKYQWNVEGQTTNELSALEAGFYMFKVTDQRNCQLVATTEVTAPGGLKMDTLITHPTCIAPEGGSIELKLSGATPPYKVVWADNKSTELARKGLAPGTYYVAISDVNGCSSSYSFTLNKPREFTVKLSEGFTMCHGQKRPITATCDEPDVKYEWYCDDTKLSEADSTIVADKAGTYRVVATNPQGCTAEDEVTIHVSRETLNLEFAVPTAIAIGSDIHAVNLSTVSADRIQWHLPEEAQLLKQSDTEVVFSIRKKGAYTLSLEGFKGDCSTIVTRTIHVMDKDDVSLPDDQPPLIKQFLVTPNPTTGYFKVMVELNSEEDFTMMLYSPSGVLMDKKEAVKVQNKTFEYEVNGTLQGTYLLHLQTKSDKSVLQIVIKRD